MDPERPIPIPERAAANRARSLRERGSHGRRLLGFVALALVLVIALFTVRPAYKHLLRWRANSLVDQAAELSRQQLFPEAIEKLDAALRVDPSCTSGLRALGDVYRRFELPAALPVLKALASSVERTDDDVRKFIEVALRLERFDLVEGELSRLLAQPNIENSTRILATEYFYRLGDFPRAIEFANDIRRLEPTNNLNHLRAAKVLLNTPSVERQKEGAILLTTLKDLSPLERLNVAEILVTAPSIPASEARKLLGVIPAESAGSASEFLLRSDVQLRLQPGDRNQIVSTAVARYRSGSPTDQADLCLWLLKIGEHNWVLRAYTAADATRLPEVFPLFAEALARAERWTELQKVVEAQLSIEAWQLETLRAASAEHLQQAALAEEHWRRAFEAVAGSPARLRDLGDFALRLDATTAAIRAYRQLSDHKLYRGSAYRRLAQIFQRSKSAEPLREVMQAWSAGSDNPAAENAYCYLSALLGRDLDGAYARAGKLFKAMPKRVAYRSTLAFLELRRGHASEAFQLFDRATIDPSSITPQTRLVHALILEANGQREEARKLVKDLKTDTFLPEELELLRRLTAA